MLLTVPVTCFEEAGKGSSLASGSAILGFGNIDCSQNEFPSRPELFRNKYVDIL